MKINKVLLKNFCQYHGEISVNLGVDRDQNVILISGRNGFGKTNFLRAVMWCLYGEQMMEVNDLRKRNSSSYTKFLKTSSNTFSQKETMNGFSVEIQFDEIYSVSSLQDSCVNVKRIFKNENFRETLQILDSQGDELFLEASDDEKKDFVHRHLIPIEAAKFVFFDAEEIASWAELSMQDEGILFNDALEKILGLELYVNTIKRLKHFIQKEKKMLPQKNCKNKLMLQKIKLN